MEGSKDFKTFIRIPVEHFGMFMFRTCCEYAYLDLLNAIPFETIESWHRQCWVENAALGGPHPLLVAEFRYCQKRTSYWQDLIQN